MSNYYTDQGESIKLKLKKGIDILENELKSKILQIKDELINTNDTSANSHIIKCDEISNNITDNLQIKIIDESDAVKENAEKWQGWYNQINNKMSLKLDYNLTENSYNGFATNGDKVTYIDTTETWKIYSDITINNNGYIEFKITTYENKQTKRVSREKGEEGQERGNTTPTTSSTSETVIINDETSFNKYNNVKVS